MVNRDQKEVRIAMVLRWYLVIQGTDYGSGIQLRKLASSSSQRCRGYKEVC